MSPRKAASCGNVTGDHLRVVLSKAKCHMSHCSVTVLEKPSPREQSWEALCIRAQMVVMFVLLRAQGERIPDGRGEGERGRRRIPSVDKEFSMS